MSYSSITLVEQELNLTAGSINSSSLPSSTAVSNWLTEADNQVDLMTGNVYSSSLESSVEFDWESNDNLLRVKPFSSVNSLWYSSEAAGETPSWTLKTENTDYYTHGEEGEIEFEYAKFKPVTGKRRFMLTYTTGASSVPASIQSATTKIVANRVVSAVVANQATEQSGGSVQVGTIKIEDPTAFSITAYKARQLEANDYLKSVIGTFKTYRIARAYDL